MQGFLKRHLFKIVILFLLFIGFLLRVNGLSRNFSFWTDEASTARFARGVVETGIPKSLSTGYISDAYYVTHYLTGLSFLVMGENELAARLPEVLFGTLLILVVYFFGERLWDKKVGLGAAVLTTFSTAQIAWSRQARGYTIFEVFLILSLYFLYRLAQDKKISSLILLVFFAMMTILTHTLGFILIPICLAYLTLRWGLTKILCDVWFWLILILSIGFLSILPISLVLIRMFFQGFKIHNFLSYYHSLFWRQYPLLVFFSLLSFVDLFFKKEMCKFCFWLISLSLYLAMDIFFLHVPFEKYGLAVFPLLFILSSASLVRVAESFFPKKINLFLSFGFLVFFIVLNGNKFSLKPKLFYSLNNDAREIPEVDYKGVYELIRKETSSIGLDKVAIIDIDEDITSWYLSEEGNYFSPRKDSAGEEKSISTGAVYIHNMKEFGEVYKKYPYGFILLMEHNFRFYPEGMVDWARKNLVLEKKEGCASFAPDWNYWPIELYSWGFNNVK